MFAKYFNFEDFDPDTFSYLDSEYFIDVTQKEYSLLADIVTTANSIFLQAYTYYYADIEKNLPDFIGFHPLFRKDFPLSEFFIGRYDILLDTNGNLQFLETNANTPGMIGDLNFPAKLLTPPWYTNQIETLKAYIQAYWKEKKELYNLKTLGIITAYSHADEDYYTCVNYAQILEEVFGKDNIFVGDIFETNIVENSILTLKWEKIDAVLSYFPLEFYLTDIEFANNILYLISQKHIFYTNPLESMILQDKLIFAVVWENIEKYSLDEQEFIRKHIPFTTREFQENSEEYIAKWRFGRYWREIHTNNFYTNITEPERYIFQKKIQSELFVNNTDFLVLSAYTNYQECLGWIARRQPVQTTDDYYNKVTFLYTQP